MSCEVTEGSQAHNGKQLFTHNEIFLLTCGGNTVKSYEGVKACGCPREDSTESKGHKPPNTMLQISYLCLTEKNKRSGDILPSYRHLSELKCMPAACKRIHNWSWKESAFRYTWSTDKWHVLQLTLYIDLNQPVTG